VKSDGIFIAICRAMLSAISKNATRHYSRRISSASGRDLRPCVCRIFEGIVAVNSLNCIGVSITLELIIICSYSKELVSGFEPGWDDDIVFVGYSNKLRTNSLGCLPLQKCKVPLDRETRFGCCNVRVALLASLDVVKQLRSCSMPR
jgi:hypothetical protein